MNESPKRYSQLSFLKVMEEHFPRSAKSVIKNAMFAPRVTITTTSVSHAWVCPTGHTNLLVKNA